MAFVLRDTHLWTGGLNYYLNLFEVLRELPGRPVEPVVFLHGELSPEARNRLVAAIGAPPRALGHAKMGRALRFLGVKDEALAEAFQCHGVEVVFQVADWYGPRFPLPVLAWIPDFQHAHLPQMFSRGKWLRREVGFRLQVADADGIMLSSEDARHDCETLFPQSRGKTVAVPFAVGFPELPSVDEQAMVRSHYRLPDKYFFLPNQFWRHKNHSIVLDALAHLGYQRPGLTVVATGQLTDPRDQGHVERLLARVKREGFEDSFRVLGLIPYRHVQVLLSGCVGLINPSRFEGWSTTVEEGRAMGTQMVLSDLRVHREQSPEGARFFDPMNPVALAGALTELWDEPSKRRATHDWEALREANRFRRAAYGRAFLRACESCIEASRPHGT